jgi:hypothetical protein
MNWQVDDVIQHPNGHVGIVKEVRTYTGYSSYQIRQGVTIQYIGFDVVGNQENLMNWGYHKVDRYVSIAD